MTLMIGVVIWSIIHIIGDLGGPTLYTVDAG